MTSVAPAIPSLSQPDQPMPATEKTGPGRRLLLYALVLFLAAVLQYSYSLTNEFVWDSEIVFHDPSIQDFKYLPDYFTEDFYRHVTAGGSQGVYLRYYRPLVKTIHLLEYQVFGTNPVGYNAVNVLLNAALVVLAFLLVNALSSNMHAAFLAALLYAVNPSRAEVVSWAYSDSYLFAAIFSLLSLLLYQKRRFLLSYAGFALSLFCHESAILLPVIVMLAEYLLSQETGGRRFLRTAPFFGLAAAFLVLRRAVVGATQITGLDPATLANTIAVIVKRSVKIAVLPDAPIAVYPLQFFPRITGEVAASYAVLAVLAAVGYFLWSRNRHYLFWYLWFFVWIAVTFNIGPLGEYLLADKLLFLASLGFCTLAALAVVNANMRRTAVLLLAASLVIVHASITFDRTRYYRNNIVYFEKALEFAPDFYPANFMLGGHYLSLLQPDKAIPLFEKALVLRPGTSQVHNNLGTAYYLKGDVEKAVEEWGTAIRLDPSNPVPHLAIAMVREKRGQYAEALGSYRRSLALTPDPSPSLISKIRTLEAMVGK